MSDWEEVQMMRHRLCGNVGCVVPGTVPHCPLCSLDSAPMARCRAAIIAAMHKRQRLTVSRLRDLTNAYRYAGAIWKEAFDSLVRAGEITVEAGQRRQSRIAVLNTASPNSQVRMTVEATTVKSNT